MNRITFRLGIALLTFVVGVTAVSLWFFLRRDAKEKKIEVTKHENTSLHKTDINKICNKETDVNVPKVKAIYISEPLELYGPKTTLYGSIVIFYENGDWGRLSTLLLDPVGSQLRIQVASGFVAEIGRWTENNGEIIVSVEGSYYSSLREPPREKITYPITESWHKVNGNRKKNSIFALGKEKYKQTGIYKFLEYEFVEFPFITVRNKTSCCDCTLIN